MSQGRRAYGIKKKAKRDSIHFKKEHHQKEKTEEEKKLSEIEHPSAKKGVQEKLKKPRDYHK